jgi:hypothetical protein
MQTSPKPVATLTAILCERWFNAPRSAKSRKANAAMPWVDGSRCAAEWAALATAICRLAPAVERQGVAECNGEWFDGQRESIMRRDNLSQSIISDLLGILDDEIQAKRAKIAAKVDALNVKLAQFALCANAHAGGGLYLGISSTDVTRPLDMIVSIK